MKDYFEIYLKLNKLFKRNGFKLYIVGGYVRDLLFKKPIKDLDLSTDAKPYQIKSFLPEADYEFEDVGHLELYYDNVHVDIDTLCKINGVYYQPRKPTSVLFIKDLSIDYLNRDFSINSLYMDENKKIYDFNNGIYDIKHRILKTNINPDITIRRNPITILRAIRFSLLYNLTIDPELKESMIKNSYLLDKINDKFYRESLNKILEINNSRIESILKEYKIYRR